MVVVATTACRRLRWIGRAGVATLVLVTVGGCHERAPSRGSPWTGYYPDSQPQGFIAAVSSLEFLPVAQDSEPHEADGKRVYVDIAPEATLDGFDVAHVSWGNPGQFSRLKGRVLAKLQIRDLDRDFRPLGLDHTKKNIYVVWWVETVGQSDPGLWKNHYYVVDPQTNTVKEVAEPGGARKFLFIDDHYASPRHLADWNKNTALLFPPVPGASTALALNVFSIDHNSTWVSCGGGCCNGR